VNAANPNGAPRSDVEFNLLQQQLITVRARLDRQVMQLMRLSQVSNQLLGRQDDWPVAPAFAEAIVDVLDVAVAAVWVFNGDRHEPSFGSCGLTGSSSHLELLEAAGPQLAASLAASRHPTRRLDSLGLRPAVGESLADALVCPGIGRDGTLSAVVLAANTATTAGIAEPISDDTAALLAVLAEKCAAHLDHRSDRRRHEADIHRLAFFDPLTDLPNRRLLGDRLQKALQQRDHSGDITAVVMLDLDRFKTLNDTHGHAAGDQLLRAVGRRLTTLIRHSDTVARLSGDEFVLLLEHLGSDVDGATRTARMVADNVLHALNEPYQLDVGTLHHSASIGVAVADEPHRSVETLLKQADVALYQAKADGRNSVRFFHPSMQVRVDTRSAMEAHLREGLHREEFSVVYQALVDGDRRIVGAEALLRWTSAHRGAVPPAEFIPVAEECGVIHPLGEWMLDAVCKQLVSWQRDAPPGFRVSVNLSAPEFLHPDFPDRVLATLHRHHVDGRRLRLEITEATVLTDLAYAAERMDHLRDHGIEFSLDDFGTGYSSLTYLRRLPVDEVKIDRSYVHRVLVDPDDSAIVRAVLALCDALDLRVVAEGVETSEQWAALAGAGCTHFQGFLFGRPMPPPALLYGLAATHQAALLRVGG